MVEILGDEVAATHERRVRRAAERQGYSLVTSRREVGTYSLRDVFTTVVDSRSLSYCEAWLATPVGGDVDATHERLRRAVQHIRN